MEVPGDLPGDLFYLSKHQLCKDSWLAIIEQWDWQSMVWHLDYFRAWDRAQPND